VAAALESVLRAWRIATTLPQGPVYVALDAALQEEALPGPLTMPALDRFSAATPAVPSAAAVDTAAALLAGAQRPLILIGRVANSVAAFEQRIALAERLGAAVLTDIKTGASFPTRHPLHPCPPSLYVSGVGSQLIHEADVILSLDWVALGGTLRQACGGALPTAKVIQCSLVDQYLHNGHSMDHQSLPPTDLAMLAPPDALVEAPLGTLAARSGKPKLPGSRRRWRPLPRNLRHPRAAPPKRAIAYGWPRWPASRPTR
jgi:thiamine pyrophosphate-dependent acetolactate synthase large subunit-like protein